ncbi:MAG: aldehyde ferredoxin oxidoreductase family protein [Anaerolineales bacterium]|nr:aldehyde ferredoxin oxidoreductase family protein [Anaerolineales bacterium]
MHLNGAFSGKILRVNLSQQVWQEEELFPEIADRFLGGRGLGAWLLYNELMPGIDPLGPENIIIFTTGPLTGTSAPSSGRFNLATLSPLTGLYLYSICSGSWGAELKMAGYDALIVEGVSSKPLYLVIENGKVSFKDAYHLQGVDTLETQRLIRQELSERGEFEVACIGPAGEKLSRMAIVMNGMRAAGRGGPGAVMGSKRLKAIAVLGKGVVRVNDIRSFTAQVRKAWKKIDETPFVKQGLGRYGSAITVGLVSEYGVMPTRNWQTGVFEEVESLKPQTFRPQVVVKDVACPACTVACSKVTQSKNGVQAEGPEYETLYSLGSDCGVGDIHHIIEADILCDRLGLDTISAGAVIGYAMECAERGLLQPDLIKGLDLRFGNGEILSILIRMMAGRSGIGDLMADGVEVFRKKVSIEDDSFSMHAKGMELGGYDPRGIRAQSLVVAAGPRGGCHHAGGYVIALELTSGKYDRLAEGGKGPMVRQARDFRAVMDSAIYCAFQGLAVGLVELGALLEAATGMEWSVKKLLELGERCSNVERAFNVRQGLRRSDDVLPGRLLHEPMPEGPSKGEVVNLDPMLDEFYTVCGWDGSTGIPTPEKLCVLGLDRIAGDMQSLIGETSAG